MGQTDYSSSVGFSRLFLATRQALSKPDSGAIVRDMFPFQPYSLCFGGTFLTRPGSSIHGFVNARSFVKPHFQAAFSKAKYSRRERGDSL